MRRLVLIHRNDSYRESHPVGVLVLGADLQVVYDALSQEHLEGLGHLAGSGGGCPHGSTVEPRALV